MLEHMRETLGRRADISGFAVKTMQGGPPAGKPIDFWVRSRDDADVPVLVDAVVTHLEGRFGVFDVGTEAAPGTFSYVVRLDAARAARFGVRESTVAAAFRRAMEGEQTVDLVVDERTTEVRVGQATPERLTALRDLPITLPDGRTIRTRQVADVVRTTSGGKLHRVNGQRAVRIFADLDPAQTSGDDERLAMDKTFAALSPSYPRASLFYGGEIADLVAAFANVPLAILLSGALIYCVLAVQFQSYVQPLVILAAIPLGLAGAILGLFVLQMDLSFLATIGAVALTGIVVNDSLVLVDFINIRRREGMPLREAVVQASLTRLRPILITTVTTVLGLLPLAIGLAGREPLLAPMAVSISFGLAFATSLTLVVVPVLYLLLDDISTWCLSRLPASWGGH
jgi:multidrug efflux pump subunit AcrB